MTSLKQAACSKRIWLKFCTGIEVCPGNCISYFCGDCKRVPAKGAEIVVVPKPQSVDIKRPVAQTTTCVCVCSFVHVCQQDYCRSKRPISLKSETLCLGLPFEELTDFWWWSISEDGFWSIFHFPQHCRIGRLGDLLAFVIQLPVAFMKLGRMTDAD